MENESQRDASPPTQRRLSDLIAQAFFRAQSAGDEVTANHLRAALESLLARERAMQPVDRRVDQQTKSELEMIVRPVTADPATDKEPQ